MRSWRLLLPLTLVAAPLVAQDLRRGLVDADLVAVARQVGKEEVSADLHVHRLQIVEAIRGVPTGATSVAVIDWPKLALHQRPTPRQDRIYCLQDASKAAARANLPAERGPYFTMVGWEGSNPAVGADRAADPLVRFARLLASTETGADAAAVASTLAELAIEGAPEVRSEAARFLAERPDLRARLAPVHWSRLMTRVSGEVDDVPYKIALAELCAEQRLPGLPEALAVGVGAVRTDDYLRTVGRLTAAIRGEDATELLMVHVRTARDPKLREALLRAIGATQTQSALDTLLGLRRTLGADPAVQAALAEHKSRAAREASLQGSKAK